MIHKNECLLFILFTLFSALFLLNNSPGSFGYFMFLLKFPPPVYVSSRACVLLFLLKFVLSWIWPMSWLISLVELVFGLYNCIGMSVRMFDGFFPTASIGVSHRWPYLFNNFSFNFWNEELSLLNLFTRG